MSALPACKFVLYVCVWCLQRSEEGMEPGSSAIRN